MSKVDDAINQFLDSWEEKGKIISVLLSGSYAVGRPSKNSDVDLLLILDKKVNWEERGNMLTKGYLIEYIAKPAQLWQKILSEEEKSGKKLYSYMFAIAKVIQEKDNIASELTNKANQIVTFVKRPEPTLDEIEMMKYHIYDRLNDLKDANQQQSPSFNAIYYFLLSTLINSYASAKGIDVPSTSKVYKFLTNDDFRKNYKMTGCEDKKFIKLAVECYRNPIIDNIIKLSAYVTESLGGFNSENWKLRNNVEN